MTYDLMCATFNLSNFLFAFLLALTGMLCVVVIVLSLMLYTRHKADVKRLEKHVYTKETWTKTSDCAKNTENKTVKNTAQKKLRHGKKKQAKCGKRRGRKMRDRIKKSILLVAVGIVVNIALAAIKMYVGLASNSLCIMLDAMNSFLDTLTCIVTLIVFIVLLLPRGENAPYGYGRGEYLAGFIVAVVSVVMGGLFFVRSLNRMAMPEPVYYGWQSIVLISACLPIKLGIGLAYMFANKKICSQAVRALMLDSFLDMGITATSLVAFAVTARVDYAVDAIVGIVMSIVIVAVGIKMVVENVRAIVLGDGAKVEIAAIEDACKSQNATLVKTELHDYGYGAKVGNAFVKASKNSDFEAMSAEVKEKTNASVTFVDASVNNEGKNNNQAENQNKNTNGEGGNSTENEGESEYSSIENNEK